MEPKERRNAVARAILRWLYEEDGSYPLVEDFLASAGGEIGGERVGNDELVRTVRWLHDRKLIEGPEVDEVPYPVRLALTTAGRLMVVEQDGWVEQEAATPSAGEKPTVQIVARAFLLWLYPVESQQPTPQKFLQAPRSLIANYQIDEKLMSEAVRLLVAKGLVDGPGAWGSDIPIRVRLTDAGRICVIDHDGNVTKQATWAEVERGGGTTVDKSITTTGSGNTVVAHSDNVTLPVDPRDRPDFIIKHGRVREPGHPIVVTMTSGPQQQYVTLDVAVLKPREGIAATVSGGERSRMVRDLEREIVVDLEPPRGESDVVVEVVAVCEDVDAPGDGWTWRRAFKIPGFGVG
ncbi:MULTISPECIES: hypothetical protein [Pseudonocardia]|uniref:Uncharacterized protein n=3 Tax=Pseudonocardia TaxID=1847 RepID=A0A1L8QA67_PSEAH|nr:MULTISPECIES: hypothetical protein [Pseudonocardia]OJG04404.1 hypothetical protein BG618_04287 [Pseudonocardia autotrophica]OSY35690.1 hypothetical protein BG845_05901 [Pseudonocardia autotrophica]TDN75700.1 hypothetical protein C8E95_4880 [Pseudonocardia autotrophica]BBF99671.1 hypothetical protein Pdca_08810 [Pseudonocardia autotrophica]GEC28810.1 hypothetical protein PSA01_58390 [Pseudonocardia saturnea]